MKAVKLITCALLAALVCSTYYYVYEPERWYITTRCLTQAPSIAACYRDDFDFTTDFFGFRLEGNAHNLIDREIFYYGAFEKPNLFLLRDLMKSIYGSQGTFIDIGANIGQHSLFMSLYSKQVHAFEPWEPVLKRFRKTVDMNHIKNITIHPYGLGDENSKKPFFKPDDRNLGTGSFVEGWKAENAPEGELEIEKGDDAFAKEGISSVSIIKMDIEGYEKLALRGLRQTLIEHRPILIFEISTNPQSPVSIKSKEELLGLFPEKYEFAVISEKSDPLSGAYFLEPVDGVVRFEQTEQHDLLAFPDERKNDIPRKGPKILN